ncbi:MAG: hypothetical protein AAF789_01695 [Bacteroidota bacterium]
MKKFKTIFHIIYVIIALVVLYFSIDILLNLEAYLSKVKLSSYVKFPRYIMIVFLMLSLFMLIGFILERLNVLRIKSGISDKDNEIVRLKAKLFDQSEQAPALKAPEEADDEDDDEDEESEEKD